MSCVTSSKKPSLSGITINSKLHMYYILTVRSLEDYYLFGTFLRQHDEMVPMTWPEPFRKPLAAHFFGLVRCVDCGEKMILHRAHTMAAVKNNFMCSTYRKRGKEECSAHYLREVHLTAIVLDDLLRVNHFARQQEALFIQFINKKNNAETRRGIERLQRELELMRRRDTELSTLFKRLYEDNVLGRVTNEQFRMLSGDYNAEQKSLKERIPQAAERIEELQASISNVTRFIDKAKRYTEINELSGELLNVFIEKMEVGERSERYSRTAEQEIIIHYRDIDIVGAFAEEAEKVAKQRQRQTA